MAQPLAISTWIAWSKIAQYLASNDKSKGKVFDSGSLAPSSPKMIFITRKLVEFAYNNNNSDSTLETTGTYLYSLISRYVNQASMIYSGTGCIAPSVLTSPSTQTVGAGNTATFVSVFQGNNLTYQWYKGGVLISGATSTVYSIPSVVSGDAGSYTCVATNGCGTATTSAGVLTVGAGALVGYYYFGDTDYYAALNGGTDSITYNGNFSIVNGDPLTVPFPVGASDNKYNVTKYPVSQGYKTSYDNHTPNVGSMPDSVYRGGLTETVVIGSWYYIISRNAMSLNSSFPMIFS